MLPEIHPDGVRGGRRAVRACAAFGEAICYEGQAHEQDEGRWCVVLVCRSGTRTSRG